MPAQQLMVGWMGASKQAGGAKGGAATSPATFGFGLTSGKVANAAITQAPDPITIAGSAAIGRNAPSASRTDVGVAFQFSTLAYPRLLGLLLYGVAGSLVTSGTGPFTQTITPALTLPYLAFFGKKGTSPLWTKATDCLIDELTFHWDGRSAPQVDCSVAGLGLDPDGSSFTWTNDESTTSYFVPANSSASYQLDEISNTPAACQLTAASFHFANNLAPVPLSKSVVPDDLVPGLQLLDGSITVIPNDYADWKKIVSGAASGVHSIANVPTPGSFSCKLAIDANTDITFASTDKVYFTADLSDVNPSGGPDAIQLNFQALGATAPWSVVMHNSVASY